MIKVSAPGKLMLFGEHAVVYNRPCIVTSVDHRMSVFLKKRKDKKISLNAPDIDLKNFLVPVGDFRKPLPKKAKFVLKAISNFFEKYKVKSGLEIETRSEFSHKIGLGSSSAVVVSTIKGLRELFRIKMKNKELFDLSYKTILDVQGVGSGFDIAAAIHGEVLFFITAGKVIKPIVVRELPIVIGYTGIKADTPTLVKMVSERLSRNPQKINKVFDEIKKIVNLAKLEIEKSNWEKVGHLMNLNQELLRELGVSSSKLESLIEAALRGGAFGAKLSGAGGGDCMIAITERKNLDNVKDSIKKAGGQIVEVKVPAKGVRVEQA